jgi:hypothetical protein
MADPVMLVLAVIGGIYVILTVWMLITDGLARSHDRRSEESLAFRKFVETMRRLEDEDHDRAGDA